MFPQVGSKSILLKNQSKDILKIASLNRKYRELSKRIKEAKHAISCIFSNLVKHRIQIDLSRDLILTGGVYPLKPDTCLFRFIGFLNSELQTNPYPEGVENEYQSFGLLNYFFYSFNIPTDSQYTFNHYSRIPFFLAKKISEFLIALFLKRTINFLSDNFIKITFRIIQLSFLILFPRDQSIPLYLLDVTTNSCPTKASLLEEQIFLTTIYDTLASINKNDIISDIIFKIWIFFNTSLTPSLLWEKIGFKLIVPLYRTNRLLFKYDLFIRLIPSLENCSLITDNIEYELATAYLHFYRWILDSILQYLGDKDLAIRYKDHLYEYSFLSITSVFNLIRNELLDLSSLTELQHMFMSMVPSDSSLDITLVISFYILFSYFNFFTPSMASFFDKYISNTSPAEIRSPSSLASICNILYLLLTVIKKPDLSLLPVVIGQFRSFLLTVISTGFNLLTSGNVAFILYILFTISSSITTLFYLNNLTFSYNPGASGLHSFVIANNCELFDFSEISNFIVNNCDVTSSLFKICTSSKKPSIDKTDGNISNVLLAYFYYLVPPKERLEHFNSFLVDTSKKFQSLIPEKIFIRKKSSFKDGLMTFRTKTFISHSPWSVVFVDDHGNPEPGIDGGGLFRQFISEALSTALDPENGLFELFDPESNSKFIYPSNHPVFKKEIIDSELIDFSIVYRYIGHLMGRFVLSRLPLHGCIDLVLPSAFWSQILQSPFYVSIETKMKDLRQIDPTYLYHLLQLRNFLVNSLMSPDDLAIYDDTNSDAIVDVSNINSYISTSINRKLFNRYFINISQGFFSVIPSEIFSIFRQYEIACIIDGRFSFHESTGVIVMSNISLKIDVDDWRSNSVYSPPYSIGHSTIKIFWDILSEWTQLDLSLLLKFCTGYSSPPYLGFSHLHPLFCIGFGSSDINRLPTASTCVNMLTLPEYLTKEIMITRLRVAIECEEFLLA